MIKLILILNFFVSLCLSQFLIRNTGPCSCDYTPIICDVGCCCDESCPSLPSQVSACANNLISPQHGCVPSDVVFGNNTPFSVSNVGGQLCVYRDDYALRNFYVAPNLARTDVSQSASPLVDSPSFQGIPAVPNSLGTTIYTFRPVGFLATSRAGPDGSCIDGQSILYLVNENVQCTRPVTNIATDCASLPGTDVYRRSPDMVVAAFPQAMNLQINLSTNLTGTGNFIIPTYTCNGSQCTTVAAPSFSGTTCSNIVTGVSILITGDTAITGVTIALTLGNVVSGPIQQTFQVTFNKAGLSPSTTQDSGAPGYLTGRPLKSRFSNNINGIWYVPSGGDCVTGTKISVLFGQNSESGCTLSDQSTYFTSLMSSWPVTIGPYGNSVTPGTSSWVPVIWENVTASGGGAVRLMSQTVTVLFARDGTLTAPQNKVIGVQLSNEFAPSTLTSSPLAVSVRFLDASQPPFDVDTLVAKRTSGRSVLEFLYLFQVEDRSVSIGFDLRALIGGLALGLLHVGRL